MYSNILKYNNDIWLSKEFLVSNGVNPDYIRVAQSRSRSTGAGTWYSEKIANATYFNYQSLPEPTTSLLPHPAKLYSEATEVKQTTTEIITTAIYTTFKRFLKDRTDNEAKSAAVIHEAYLYINNNNIKWNKSRFFRDLAEDIKAYKLKYLPSKWTNLRDKIRAYADGQDITKVVYAKNKGNKNHVQFKEDKQVINWMVELGSSQKNYSYAFIHRKLVTTCLLNGLKKAPSRRWTTDFLAKSDTQYLISQRYGENSRFNANYRPYVPTQSALFAGDCWEIDGTRVNLIDHTAVGKDKNGKTVRLQKYLYIVVVRDVMSGLPVGWEYCYEESSDVIINALAMAVRNTGYLPYELRYDKFPGHNTADWQRIEKAMIQLGVVLTQTVKADGKAHIERFFGTLQDVFMSENDYYYGEGIRSTRHYAHRAKEYIAEMHKKAKKEGFDFNMACEETDKILDAYANTKLSWYSEKYKKIDKSPLELHDECSKQNVHIIEKHTFCYIFGLVKQVSPRSYMIQTQISGATYYYGIDDCEVVEKYTGVKLTNCFDYEDLSEVHLYYEGKYLGSFRQVTPAQQYGPEKDMRAVGILNKIADNNKKNREDKILKLLKEATGEELNEVSPELGVLLGGKIPKHSYEGAVTALLHEDDDQDEVVKIDKSKIY